MTKLNPYLNFDGNAEEAFNFYKSIFGGDFLMLMRFTDAPNAEQINEADRQKIMHISLVVGESTLMASDVIKGMGPPHASGNNFNISINCDSREQADDYFKKLGEGGTIVMPIEDQFWGSYFGLLVDKFGIQWMIDFENPK